ncbi:hypothetical protein COU76_03045 [Candidatus Peregrinibacteria bacterium CG10_big_fil_rev_8_21_14_0_10_49_10]|nr:MAG: hypothetical protein COU76_03045 [Candidatus Peregrinibacteria bacterium CG10_big_fil_rev_8_21_14_0_10_49_10]
MSVREFLRHPRVQRGITVLATVAIVVTSAELLQRVLFELSVPYLGDSTFFMALGRGILNGLTPYRDLFETKPPSIFLLVALSLWATKGMLLARIFQVLAILTLGAMIIVPVRIFCKKHSLQSSSFGFLTLLFGLVLSLYTAQSGGMLYAESFGAVFLAGYAAVLFTGGQQWTKKHVCLSALCILLASGIKEPFVLAAFFVALLLTHHPRDLVQHFFIPLLLAGVAGVVLLALFGYLQPYVGIYLPIMFRSGAVEPLWIRGLVWDFYWKELSHYSVFLGCALLWLIVSILLVRLSAWRNRKKAVTLALFLVALLGIMYAFRFVHPDFGIEWLSPALWTPGFLLLCLLVCGFIFLALPRRNVESFYAVFSVFAGAYGVVLLSGIKGQFLDHHLVFAVPIYAAFFFVWFRLFAKSDHFELSSTVLLLFLFLTVVFHYRMDYRSIQHDLGERLELQTQWAATVDDVLDRCGKERYVQFGPLVHGYTRHSPLGPGFFQEKLNNVIPLFQSTFQKNLMHTPLIIRSTEEVEITQEQYDYLVAHFTKTPWPCASSIRLPQEGMMLLFRKEAQEEKT